MQQRGRVRDCLAGAAWGASRESLREVHLAYVQSKTEYALPAFGPYAPAAALKGLATEQYYGACKVSGCPRGGITACAAVLGVFRFARLVFVPAVFTQSFFPLRCTS